MHHQCEFEGGSGWGKVEVVGGLCEVGQGCVADCPYSWQEKDRHTESLANRRFAEFAESLIKPKFIPVITLS